MDDDRLAHLTRAIAAITTEMELAGFMAALEQGREMDGVIRHHCEVRRKEIQTGKRVRA